MKLFAFVGAETDWVAADDERGARECLRRHYGVTDEDIAGSYEEVSEVDPSGVELYTDPGCIEEDEEDVTTTAADLMRGKSRPFLVASTYGH